MIMDVEGYFQDLMLERTQAGETLLDYLPNRRWIWLGNRASSSNGC